MCCSHPLYLHTPLSAPLQMFFAVLIGAFSINQAGLILEELGVAAGAMEFIYETIHRVGGASMGQLHDHTQPFALLDCV